MASLTNPTINGNVATLMWRERNDGNYLRTHVAIQPPLWYCGQGTDLLRRKCHTASRHGHPEDLGRHMQWITDDMYWAKNEATESSFFSGPLSTLRIAPPITDMDGAF